MQNVVELWVSLSATPLFGLTATLTGYVLAQAVSQRLGHPPLANPVLWTVFGLAALLWLTGTSCPTYFSGAQFIHFLLGPAAVALAWPLWQRRAELRQRWLALLVSALAPVFAVLTGLVGAVLAKPLFDLLRVRAPEVRGFAIGTASHGIGAARAMQVHPSAGAYAALALGLQVLLAALLMPPALWLLSR